LLRAFERHAEVARTVLLNAHRASERAHIGSYYCRVRTRRATHVGTDRTRIGIQSKEITMPKGQPRSNKESKKPKQDKSPAKSVSPSAVTPQVTTVVPDRRKKK
jgi:hypothetical protein